tara:strand:- start:1315 stop:3900 length:2586 start_codon:yes stop_codon:yes gene_type:complete
MATSDIGALSVKITADTKGFEQGVSRTNKKLESSNKHLKKNAKSFNEWSSSLNLNTIALSAAFGVATHKAIAYADSFTSITNKLKLATADSEQLRIVTDKLFESSNNTGTAVESTVELYAKLERSTRDLNVSQDRLLNITESISKAFVISGASTQEANGSIRQLGQALASGALRGDEFNSIAEQAPIIMEAVSKATGKTAGQLRALAAEGKITSKILIDSLERYKKKIDKDFSTAQKTFAQKTEAATNSLIKFVGESDSVTGAVDGLGDALIATADNLETIGSVLNVVVIAAIGKYTGALLSSTASTISNTLATSANFAAKVTLAKAELKQATIAAGFAVQEQAAAKRMLSGTVNTVIRAKAVDKLAIANGRLSAAQTAVTASTARLAVAQAATAVTTRALGASMAFLGGPLGVAVIAGLALFSFADGAEEAKTKAKLTADEVTNLSNAFSGLSRNLKLQKLNETAAEMATIRNELIATGKKLADVEALAAKGGRGYTHAMSQAEAYKKEIIELNSKLNLLSEKQGLLVPAIDTSEFTKRDMGNGDDLIGLDGSSEPTKADKAKIEREKLATAAFLEELANRFRSAEELENNRFNSEFEKLQSTYTNKNELTAEQNQLEQDLTTEHLSKLREIEEAMKPIDNSIGVLEALGLQYTTEEEMLIESLARKKAILDQAKIDKTISEEDYQSRSLALTQASEEAKRKITLQNVQQGFAALLSHSKKAQKVMQKVAIVQAVMKGKTAAVSAWEAGMATGGPWAPAVAASYAAASIANTASMISSIKSGGSSMSGMKSGGASSTGGSKSSAPQTGNTSSSDQSAVQSSRQISINMVGGGGLFSTDQVRELIGQINDQVGDGVSLITE